MFLVSASLSNDCLCVLRPGRLHAPTTHATEPGCQGQCRRRDRWMVFRESKLCVVALVLLAGALLLPRTAPALFNYPPLNLSAAIAERSQASRSCAADQAAVCPSAFEFLPTLTVLFNHSRLAHVLEREALAAALNSSHEPVLHCRNIWHLNSRNLTASHKVFPTVPTAREPRSLNTTDNHT